MSVFFSNLERLAFFMLVTKVGVNERIERFSRLTRAIELQEVLTIVTSPLQLSATEQQAFYEALRGQIYIYLNARARSLLLLRLYVFLSGGGASYDYGTITVEHVLPQTPPEGSQWLKWFPSSDVRTSIVHTLGNLALLTRKKNSSASNYEFEHKKKAYFTHNGISPFVLTTQVLRHLEWTPQIVAARQLELELALEEHWRLRDRVRPTGQGSGPPVSTGSSALLSEKTATSPDYGGDGSWRDDVVAGLMRVGGRAALKDIYRAVEDLRVAGGRSVPSSIEAVIRKTLEENSTDFYAYRGGPDIFYMPEGKGVGIWAIRKPKQ